MSEPRFTLQIEFDEKRQGYWITGSGFDFFAYFTSDDDSAFIECDRVQRDDKGFVRHLQLRLGASGKVHKDIFETALQNELGRHWDP